ncbi:NAM-like protein [Panicum miliaceum]|uniref:NAM-like protein n=1 Tax=Panicum miliaceum TaxID=4540 RepID=A0A3L6QQ30_PANMI|nr:NAM-like protein [Panicum miliaceum]
MRRWMPDDLLNAEPFDGDEAYTGGTQSGYFTELLVNDVEESQIPTNTSDPTINEAHAVAKSSQGAPGLAYAEYGLGQAAGLAQPVPTRRAARGRGPRDGSAASVVRPAGRAPMGGSDPAGQAPGSPPRWGAWPRSLPPLPFSSWRAARPPRVRARSEGGRAGRRTRAYPTAEGVALASLWLALLGRCACT